MIDDKEIEAKAKEFAIRPIEVEKDYVYGWLLKGIYSRPALAEQLVLKGGNGLRKAYLPETRFSKDLDFSALRELPARLLESELEEVCSFVQNQTQVQFLDRTVVRAKELPIPDVQALEARLYFRGFYGEENLDLRTQLDITQFDKIYLPVQARSLIHPYSDGAACAVQIRCQKLEEILASKLTTLLQRRRPADLFDLLYSTVIRNEFGTARAEIIRTFLKKSIFEPNPSVAKEQLLATPLEEFRPLWTGLVAPIRSLFAFDAVVQHFAPFIDALFALIAATPRPRPALGGGGGGFRSGQVFGRTAGLGAAPAGFFATNARGALIAAAHAGVMVELLYKGYRRLVEPYRLEYRVRKSDGRGAEYFWGYDTTGGSSGKTGIKQFFCSEIQNVRPTTAPYTARFPVEM